MRLLLDNGAEVNAECGLYGDALSAASGEGHKEIARLLLEHGADVNAHSGLTLHKALENRQEAVMRLLLQIEVDTNLVFHDDGKALHEISVDDHEAVIQLLLKRYDPLGSKT